MDTQDDILLPPIVLQVHGCIRMTASAFLRENLLGIPAVPDEKKFTELREKRMKEVQKRIQSEKMSAMEAFEQTNLAGESSKLTQLENSSTTKATTSSVTSLIRPTQLGASLVQESGWRPRVKGESVKDSQDPMIQQMNIIRDYIHQAREANKLDEVRMLENNLKELQEEYARLNLSPS